MFKPSVACIQLDFPCACPHLVLKCYLNDETHKTWRAQSVFSYFILFAASFFESVFCKMLTFSTVPYQTLPCKVFKLKGYNGFKASARWVDCWCGHFVIWCGHLLNFLYKL